MQAGYERNVPLIPVIADIYDGALDRDHSFLTVDAPNVVVDTIKQSEDGDDMIVRIYEAHGARGPVVLTFDRLIASSTETNLLEEQEKRCRSSMIQD